MLDTRCFGLPQSRPRVYIIGQRKDCFCEPFAWPSPSEPATNLDDFLLPDDDVLGRSTKTTFTTREQAHIQKASAKLVEKGIDPQTTACCIDVAASASRLHFTAGYSPCITHARGPNGFYITSKKRMMHIKEIMMLQGFTPAQWDLDEAGVSKSVLGHALGNAMSLPVLKACLENLVRAVGLNG